MKNIISDFGLNNIHSFFTTDKVILPYSKLALPTNHKFSEKRLSDFSTGRYSAIKALEQLGFYDVVIRIGKDREPIWPDGVVGSISHSNKLVGAIVAKKSEQISLGLDIEEIGRVTPDLFDLVFTEKEKSYLSSFTGRKLEKQSTMIFSVKEAFYKFQHPITKTFLDFLDVELDLFSLDKIFVLSTDISKDSIIRLNYISYEIRDNHIIAIVINSRPLKSI
jgi:4'-phosphopantetheinyl transferase EntD